MVHDDADKAAVMNDIWAFAKTFTEVVDNIKSLRVTFTPVAMTSAATQSGSWTTGLQGVGDTANQQSMNDASLNQETLTVDYAFIHNTVRS
jgi:hypothetical protein